MKRPGTCIPRFTAARFVALLGLLALLITPVTVLAQTETIEYYGTDAIGSIRIVWDANGNMTARQDFTPFGEPVLQQGTTLPKEGFVGNEADAETNQDYFHARMFEARTGRFTRTDPIEDGVGEPQRWNRYAYALNNPLVFADVTGFDPCAPTAPPGAICVNITSPPPPEPPPSGGGFDTPPDVSTEPNYSDPCLTPSAVNGAGCQKPGDGSSSGNNGTNQSNNNGANNNNANATVVNQQLQEVAKGVVQRAGALNNASTYTVFFGVSVGVPALVLSGASVYGVLGDYLSLFEAYNPGSTQLALEILMNQLGPEGPEDPETIMHFLDLGATAAKQIIVYTFTLGAHK